MRPRMRLPGPSSWPTPSVLVARVSVPPPEGRCFCSCSPRKGKAPVSTATSATGGGGPKKLPQIASFDTSRIRNLAIIAHIDSGKSTVADRMLELTGTIPAKPTISSQVQTARQGSSAPQQEAKNEQVLDTLKVERERGITVRAQSCTMFYDGVMVNLLDTPGHVDFTSELLRSLLPSQGALLLVDGTQGIQAQTLSVLQAARERGLKVVGAINKWDLVGGDTRGSAAVTELAALLDCREDEILKLSAKTGNGVTDVLDAIVKRIPSPPAALEGSKKEDMRALVFDSWYDSFRGVVSLVAVASGTVAKGDEIKSATTGRAYTVLDLGLMHPGEVSMAEHPHAESRRLRRGMVGWLTCGMKDFNDAYLGDTFTHVGSNAPPLEGFKPLKSMVFAGVYPSDPGGFLKLEDSIKKLTLTDRSVTLQRETSSFLGQGFRLGFNGSLHLEIFRQRLEDEYKEEIIVTRPLVPVKIIYKNGKEVTIDNPADFPDPGGMLKVAQVLEPTIKATIILPDMYTGPVITLCTAARGLQLSHSYISPGTSASTSTATSARIALVYELPLSSIITDFHSKLKSLTSGFASFDYEESTYVPSKLVRMNILVNGVQVDALCTVVHDSVAEKEGREWARRLREAIPRQQYEVIIQAAVGSKILARERIAPFMKNVTAGLYGGHYERKMKHLVKQREGKKRLKERMIGRISIPTSAFFTVLGGTAPSASDSKKKGK